MRAAATARARATRAVDERRSGMVKDVRGVVWGTVRGAVTAAQ